MTKGGQAPEGTREIGQNRGTELAADQLDEDANGHVGAIQQWDRCTDSLAYSPSRGSDGDLDSVSMQVMQELAGDPAEGSVTRGVFTSASLDGLFPRQPLCCFLTGSDSTIETEDRRVPVIGSRVVPSGVRYCRARGSNLECYAVEYGQKVLMRDGVARKVVRYPCHLPGSGGEGCTGDPSGRRVRGAPRAE